MNRYALPFRLISCWNQATRPDSFQVGQGSVLPDHDHLLYDRDSQATQCERKNNSGRSDRKNGSVFLVVTAEVSNELGQGDNYLYYGNNHLACETGHHMGTDNVEDFLHAIILLDDELIKGYALADKVYD